MKKQGFTLIELMVVIVIMGILAAVAVPKLFGMIAKSKASEVGPAAGTYVKLQDAYASENNTVGTWASIGYIAPGAKAASEDSSTTSAFSYSGGAAKVKVQCSGSSPNEGKTACEKDDPEDASKKINVPAVGGEVISGWVAASSAKLNDCPTGSKWVITSKTLNGVVEYTKTIAGAAPGASDAANCESLTPQFINIGK